MTDSTWYSPAQVGRVTRSVQQTLDRRSKQAATAAVEFVLSRVDLVDVIQRHLDLNRLLATVDLNAVLKRVDLATVAQNVVQEVDLPTIIRQSTGTVTSEAVRGVRVQGIETDQAITRAVDHLLHRQRRRGLAADPEAKVDRDGG
ncbi:MAG: hypothetical protein ACJ735_00370 [Actinomycetes bacterium]